MLVLFKKVHQFHYYEIDVLDWLAKVNQYVKAQPSVDFDLAALLTHIYEYDLRQVSICVAGESDGIRRLGYCNTKNFMAHGQLGSCGIAAVGGGLGNLIPTAVVNCNGAACAGTGRGASGICKGCSQYSLPFYFAIIIPVYVSSVACFTPRGAGGGFCCDYFKRTSIGILNDMTIID